MTKDEVFKNKTGWELSVIDGGEEALDEYAKQQAIAFIEWACHNYWRRENGWSDDPHSQNVITTEQLYNLFIQQNPE